MDELGPQAPMDISSSVALARRLLGEPAGSTRVVAPSGRDAEADSPTVRCGQCELDFEMQELRRGGERVHLEPQVYEVLAYLIEQQGKVVTKNELFDHVWGDRFVSESALPNRIVAARKATGDDGRSQAIIRTVHGKGFSFVAEVDSPQVG